MIEKKARGRPRVNPPKEKKTPEERYGPRPHSWLSGPDEYKHSMYVPWMRAKAQANYRKEKWNLTFEEFYDLWKYDWANRGRGADNMCMTRHNPYGAWEAGNIVLMTRHDHLTVKGQLQGFMKMDCQTSKAKKSYYKPVPQEEKEKRKALRKAEAESKPQKVKEPKKENLAEKFYGKTFRI